MDAYPIRRPVGNCERFRKRRRKGDRCAGLVPPPCARRVKPMILGQGCACSHRRSAADLAPATLEQMRNQEAAPREAIGSRNSRTYLSKIVTVKKGTATESEFRTLLQESVRQRSLWRQPSSVLPQPERRKPI